MQGRRADNEKVLYKEGDFWKDEEGNWRARPDGNAFSIRLTGNDASSKDKSNYDIVENADGSITSPKLDKFSMKITNGIWDKT